MYKVVDEWKKIRGNNAMLTFCFLFETEKLNNVFMITKYVVIVNRLRGIINFRYKAVVIKENAGIAILISAQKCNLFVFNNLMLHSVFLLHWNWSL